jgi:hypothetical protein
LTYFKVPFRNSVGKAEENQENLGPRIELRSSIIQAKSFRVRSRFVSIYYVYY